MNNHTYGRSLDQTSKNENKNEFLDSFRNNDLNIDRTNKLFEEVLRMKKTDTKKFPFKHLKENKGLLWHIQLRHVSKQYLEKASSYIPELKGIKFENLIQDCKICIQAKSCNKSSPNKRFQNIEDYTWFL